MDAKRTKEYYSSKDCHEVCDCGYCRNYTGRIKKAYPELGAFLASMGVDIEKPFECFPLEPEKESITYLCVQYPVMGEKDGFETSHVSGADIYVTECHPVTDIKDVHFVIEVSEIKLEWRGGYDGESIIPKKNGVGKS